MHDADAPTKITNSRRYTKRRIIHPKRFRPSNNHWTNVNVDAISGPNQIATEPAKHCSIRVKPLHDWEYITLHWRIVFPFSLILFTNVGI
jgi:hypothetical protein